jgi:hypothetical protein
MAIPGGAAIANCVEVRFGIKPSCKVFRILFCLSNLALIPTLGQSDQVQKQALVSMVNVRRGERRTVPYHNGSPKAKSVAQCRSSQ